jgi:B-box zinc finger
LTDEPPYEPEDSGQEVEPSDVELLPAREQFCANHPDRPTMVTCSACGKPICPDCMVYTAVGIKCKECAKMPRSARVTLSGGRFLRAVAAGLGVGAALGFAYYFILGSIGFFFLFFFVAAGIGYLVGEAVSRASGRYHGRRTAVVAALSTLWAFLIPPVTAAFISYGVSWNVVVFAVSTRGIINWLVMAFAAYLAWNRNR